MPVSECSRKRRRGTHRQLRAGASRRRAGRIAGELARPKCGGIRKWRVLRRHGLNTRAKRLSLIAGYRASYELPRGPELERDAYSSFTRAELVICPNGNPTAEQTS